MKTKLILSAILLFAVGWLNAQITITGQVTDELTGETLIGVNVIIKGTSIGSSTDIDGNYKISVPSEESVLTYSYIGYEMQEQAIGSKRIINVQLGTSSSVLDEIVLIGYTSKKRSQLTNAVSKVDAKEIEELPILRAEQALQGTTSGVQVAQQSGSPGSGINVVIRGLGSLSGSEPLYVVDGILVDNIDFLNPNDITSMDVLKDAGAAIYGARGANGVVLIKTKGDSNKNIGEVKLNISRGVQTPSNVTRMLNAREFRIFANEAYINAGRNPLPELEFVDVAGNNEGTNWLDEIIDNAPVDDYSVSFNGGDDKSSYFLSGSYFNQEGIVGGEKSGFERYTFRLNSSHNLKKWLKLSNTFSFTNLDRGLIPENNEFISPFVRAMNLDPTTSVYVNNDPSLGFASSPYFSTDILNPVHQLQSNFNRWKTNRLVGSLKAAVKFTDELSFESSLSTDVNYSRNDQFFPFDAPGNLVTDSSYSAIVLNSHNWTTLQNENILRFNRQLSEKNKFEVVLGQFIGTSKYNYIGAGNNRIPQDITIDRAFIGNSVGDIEHQTGSQDYSVNNDLSFFGRTDFEFDEKYFATLIFRADGSSKFAPGNKWDYFPGVSAGWILSKEPFFNFDAMTFLKLRASWGQNGNNIDADYRDGSQVSNGQNYVFGPEEDIANGAISLVPIGDDFKWETVEQTNIGLDIELYNGLFNFGIEAYQKRTFDLLLFGIPKPSDGGTYSGRINAGRVNNSGLELWAEHKRKFANSFKYELGANASFNNNKVIDIEDAVFFSGAVFPSGGLVSITQEESPIASFYGYVTDGIFQNQAEVDAHATQNDGTAPGDIRFKDLNADGIIDAEDRTIIGNPTPKVTFGGNIRLEFKGFDLMTFLQGVAGNQIYNGSVRYDFPLANRPAYVLDRWTGEGTSDFEPRFNIEDPNQNARASDRFIEDGSYLRIKNFQVGYTVPVSLTKKAFISKLRVYASVQNLLTFTKYSGMDPEIGAYFGSPLDIGIDKGFYPQSRMFMFGLNLKF